MIVILLVRKKESGGKTEIDFYFPVAVGGPIANLVDDLVADFEEENPNIKVNPKFGGSYEETMTQVMASVHGGNPPELAVLFSIDLFTLLENDVIEELTPLFDETYFDDFYDAFMENSSTDNKVYSLPFQRSTIVLYYNKDAFKEAGLVYTTTSEAGILQATIPIFTVILASIILKENATGLQKASILLSVAGVMYIFFMNGTNMESYNWAGIILVLFSTLSIAFYNVLARSLTRQYPLFTLTFMMSFVGFIFFNTIAIGYHLVNHSIHHFFMPLLSMKFIGAMLYLGVFASFLTSFLSNYALNKMEASRMSVFNNISILITIFAGIIFLNESIYYYHIIGAMIIIAGVFGTNYTRRQQQKAFKKAK